MNRLAVSLSVAGLLVLAACTRSEPAPAEVPDAATPAAAPAPAADPAPAPAPADPAPADAKNNPAVINFEGFGPAKFGANEEQVRMSWGRPLQAGTPAEGASCYQLAMDPPPTDGRGITFMFEDGKFVRYDVDVPLHVAPGDLKVGDRMEDVVKAFDGGVETEAHKYVEGGFNMIVPPGGGGDARLIFEIDAKGIITAWRIGMPPQVHYVEGCG